MQSERTTEVQPAPAHPVELGLRLIDWGRQLEDLAGQLGAGIAAESDLERELDMLSDYRRGWCDVEDGEVA